MSINWKRLRHLNVTNTFWALADQGLVSLGTFASSIVLARTLSPADYGLYVLIFGGLLYCNSIQYAVITFPLTVKGAASDQDRLRSLINSSLLFTAGLALVLGVGMVIAAKVIDRMPLAPWAVAALTCWQFQEVFRRALLSHQRYREAVWGDTLRHVGQAVIVLALYFGGKVSVSAALVSIALTSAIAGLVQAAQLGFRNLDFSEASGVARDFWALGRWSLMNCFAGIFFTFLAFPWSLAYFHGLQAAAALQAVMNVVGAAHPVIFGMRGLIVPAVAEAAHTVNRQAARRVALNYALQGGVIIMPFFAIVMLMPKAIMTAFYGAHSPYLAYETSLRLFAMAYILFYLSVILNSFLDGLEKTRDSFSVELVGACSFLFVGLPLVARGGVSGASVGRIFYGVMVVLAALYFCNKRTAGVATLEYATKL